MKSVALYKLHNNLSVAALGDPKSLPRLESLSLGAVPPAKPKAGTTNYNGICTNLIHLMATLKKLEILGGLEEKTGYSLSDDISVLLSPTGRIGSGQIKPPLEELVIRNHYSYDGSGLENIGYLPQLKRLELRNLRCKPSISDIAKLPNLEELDMSYTLFSDDDAEVISGCHSLRRLILKGTDVTDKGLEALSRMSWLEVLYVNVSDGKESIWYTKKKISLDGFNKAQVALGGTVLRGNDWDPYKTDQQQ